VQAQYSKVLVTGASGWLGSSLLQLLTKSGDKYGDAIRCLILHPEDKGKVLRACPGAEIVAGDIRNPANCAAFCAGAKDGLLFHTAGVIHPRRVREFYDVNREGTANLLDAAIKAGVRRAVVVSSNSPCGCNPFPDHLFDELSPYRPYMNYGRSKMAMEFAALERSERLDVVIIRAPWFYGPHQPRRQTLFFKMVRDGKAPIVGSAENLRSMAYLGNLCEGLLLASDKQGAQGKVYWIADARPYSMNEIIDTIERLLETEFGQKCAHTRMRLPNLASALAYGADAALQGLGLYHQKIHVLSEMNKTIACSINRARAELGYEPKVELEEGMRRSLRWCFETGAL
jgi:nucleoside-diphosphate-sugar epimerase